MSAKLVLLLALCAVANASPNFRTKGGQSYQQPQWQEPLPAKGQSFYQESTLASQTVQQPQVQSVETAPVKGVQTFHQEAPLVAPAVQQPAYQSVAVEAAPVKEGHLEKGSELPSKAEMADAPAVPPTNIDVSDDGDKKKKRKHDGETAEEKATDAADQEIENKVAAGKKAAARLEDRKSRADDIADKRISAAEAEREAKLSEVERREAEAKAPRTEEIEDAAEKLEDAAEKRDDAERLADVAEASKDS